MVATTRHSQRHGKTRSATPLLSKVPSFEARKELISHQSLATTYTDFKEADVDWSYVERLMPPKVIPEMPKDTGVTPSGWRPPQGSYICFLKSDGRNTDPAPNLPYFIRRTRYHLPALFLERRRDQLNPKTMDFEYVELVSLKQIYGDIFVSRHTPLSRTQSHRLYAYRYLMFRHVNRICERFWKQKLAIQLRHMLTN